MNLKESIDSIDKKIKELNELKENLLDNHYISKQSYYWYTQKYYHVSESSFTDSDIKYINKCNKNTLK